MSKHPAPTRADHDGFCKVENWTPVSDAKGRAAGHHVTYELELPDGRILRTRVSHPVNRDTYGPSIWAHILRDQLVVTADEFWKCVKNGIAPDRGIPVRAQGLIPAELVFQLIKNVGLTPDEVGTMTKNEAIGRLSRYWETGK